MLRSTPGLSALHRRSCSCYVVSYRQWQMVSPVVLRAVFSLEPSTDVEGASSRRYEGSHPSGNNGRGSPSRLVRHPLVSEDNHPALSERGRALGLKSGMVVFPRVIRLPHNPRSYLEFITQFSPEKLLTHQISEAVVAPDCSMTSGATASDLSDIPSDQNLETYSSMDCRQLHRLGLRSWCSRQLQNQRV